jgi:DNA-binding transcriptional ArsR family regulator
MAEPSEHNHANGEPFEAIISLGKAVGDRLRSSILAVLAEDSLSVSELCSIVDVPQPALSHHLKVLHQAGLVAKRREGNNIFYRRDNDAQDLLKQSVFTALDQVALSPDLLRALQRIHQQRSEHCQAFFADNAEEISSLQTQIAEPATYCETVLAIASRLSPGVRALEVGPGNGLLLGGLAEHYPDVYGIDSSAEMLAQTARTTAGTSNISLIHGDFLEWQNESGFDLIVAAMAVHHLPSPAAFFQQAHRLLRSGGSVIVAELTRHDQHWASDVCGDLWLGFEPAELQRWAANAALQACEAQFLAQKNGFQIQIQRYVAAGSTKNHSSIPHPIDSEEVT